VAKADRQKLKAEFTRLYGLDEYKALRPLLDRVEPLLNVRGGSDVEQQNGLAVGELALALVEELNARQKEGPLTHAAMKDIAAAVAGGASQAGFVSDKVEADAVIQVQGVLLNIVNQSLPEIKVPEPESIQVEFVLVGMTKSEAEDLASKAAFKGEIAILQDNFIALEAHLNAVGQSNWKDAYGASPEQWRPLGEHGVG
jgi:hypothetical protein